MEKQTGGKQVLQPEHDAELRADSPRGPGMSLSLKTPETKRPGEKTWDVLGALRPLMPGTGVWGAKAFRKLARVEGRPLWGSHGFSPRPSDQVRFWHSPWSPQALHQCPS